MKLNSNEKATGTLKKKQEEQIYKGGQFEKM